MGALAPAGAAETQDRPGPNPQVRISKLADRQLEELGIPKRFLPFLDPDAAKVRTGRELFGEPTSDLAGSPAPEVFEVDLRYSYSIQDRQQAIPAVDSEIDTRVTVRSGPNGAKLWSKRFDRDAWPIAMKLGKSGRTGVVVITGLWNFFGTTEESTLSFEAYTGSGKRLWRREYRSVSYQEMLVSVTEDAPLVIGVLDSLEGKAEDLIMGLATSAGTLFTRTMSTRVVMIDGASGAETAHPLVDVGIDWWPIPLPTHDLDGDGLDDYATTNNLGVDLGEGQEAPEYGGTVYTRKGTNGSPIWTTSGIEMDIFAFTTKLPQVVSDATPDLGLQTYVERVVPLAPFLPAPLPLPTGFRYKPRVYLFDGNGGVLRWHKPSDWLYSPGDIDRDGRRDLMLGGFRISFAKGKTVFDQLAVRGEGSRLWKRRSIWRFETMACPRGICFGGWGIYFDISPDFAPDGVKDVLLAQEIQQNEAWTDQITRAYDGRTGRVTFQDQDSLQAVGVAIDGRGTDIIGFKHDGNRVRVSARNGSNRALWTGSLVSAEKILPRRSWFWAMGFKLPGDRCGDIVVTGGEENESFYSVFDGSNGHLLWSRSTAPKQQRMRWKPSRDLNRAC